MVILRLHTNANRRNTLKIEDAHNLILLFFTTSVIRLTEKQTASKWRLLNDIISR